MIDDVRQMIYLNLDIESAVNICIVDKRSKTVIDIITNCVWVVRRKMILMEGLGCS